MNVFQYKRKKIRMVNFDGVRNSIKCECFFFSVAKNKPNKMLCMLCVFEEVGGV